MIRLNWIKNREKYLSAASIISGALAGFSSFITRWPPERFQDWRSNVLTFNKDNLWWIVPLFAALAGVAAFIKTHFGTTNSWKVVTALLEEYRKAVFADRNTLESDPDHFNRVTLYKHVKWRWMFCLWPWSQWVVPVARTGHTTQTWRIPRFKAPTGDPDNAKGVAGHAFAANSIIAIDNLPDLKNSPGKKSIVKYGRMAFVDEKWVRKKLKKGSCSIRSMVGVPIEVKGEIWGAIVVDSRHPIRIIDIEKLRGPEFTRMARLLSKLLEN